jgi:cell division protease FtsH
MTKHELQGKIGVLLGGRAAEQIVFDEVSTGAQNDLRRATEIARSMVIEYGMGETLGPVTFSRTRHPLFLREPPGNFPEGNREYSEATAQALDGEIKKIMEERMDFVMNLLKGKRKALDRICSFLMEKEVIEEREFRRLLKRESRTGED